MTQPPGPLDPADETALAKRLFNGVWALLDKDDRTPSEADEMLHMAHASRYHWGNVGTPKNLAIGEWQVARVYSALGRGEPAVYHATRCRDITVEAALEQWMVASACEGLARAYATAGDHRAAADFKAQAISALESVADPQDRAVVQGDIDTLPL